MKIIFQTLLVLVVVIGLSHCNANYTTTSYTAEYNLLDSTMTGTSASLESIIAPYNDGLESQMNTVINTTSEPMTKARPEGILSNFTADLVFEEVNELEDFEGDMCLLNHGGLRSSLPKGNIKIGDIYQLMPFDNEAVVVELSGEKIIEIAFYLADSGGEPVSNIQLNLNSPQLMTINGRPVNKSKTYKVITSDYLANGGDRMTFFENPLSIQKTGLKIRDLIIEYIKEEKEVGQTLKSELDGRISQ